MDYRLFIARRYLVSRKQVTLISIITGISIFGVSVGTAALIIVLSVMNGFYDFVRNMLVSLDPHVRIVSAETRGLADSDSLIALALELPHVVHASPYVEGKALFLHRGSAEANKVVIVRGVDPERLKGVSDVVSKTGLGGFDVSRRDGVPGIVLGMSLAQRFAITPEGGLQGTSSDVALLSAQALERMMTQVFGAPQPMRFSVRGLYELEATYDESHVFVGLREAQLLFQMPGRVSGVELRVDHLDRAGDVKAELKKRLDPKRYSVLTWYDLQKSLYDVMLLEKWGATVILALIIVVAAFNIIGSLTMVVIEKQRDVGVLQAMGVSRRNIRRIFLSEGLLIGCVGTGIGLIAGLGLALAQKYFALVPLQGAESFMIEAYPVAIRAGDVALVAAVSLGLCVLASLYPAVRAASVEPARAVSIDA